MPRSSESPTPDETPAQTVPLEPSDWTEGADSFAPAIDAMLPATPTEVESAPPTSDGAPTPSDESTDAGTAATDPAPVDNIASDGGVSAEAEADLNAASAEADYPSVEEQFLTGMIVAPESSTAAGDPGASFDDHPGYEYDESTPVPEWDPIGVVVPGQCEGASFLVVRLLGRGDDGRYGDIEAALVAQRQGEAGLPATGVVSGLTWALILPSPFGSRGGAVRGPLRQLLAVGGFNEHLDAALLAVTPENGLNGWKDANQDSVPQGADPFWVYLLGLAVHAYFARLEQEANPPVAVDIEG